MSTLTIVLTVTEEGAYLRETAEAALSSAAACGMDVELVIASSEAEEKATRQSVVGIPYRFLSFETGNLAAWNNSGAKGAAGELLLFMQEGLILTPEGLQKMAETLLLDTQIAAVGPFSNRTQFSWQYLNAERLTAEGTDAARWVREHLSSPTESLFLEYFALLVRRSAFQQMRGFDEMFTGGGADLDFSFRLKYEGAYLLRAPVYFVHRGAENCDLYDLRRSAARPLLLERWGIDIGVPETILQETLSSIVWTKNMPLIHATARSALLRTPLVSIMIPTYNRPGYFRETLESARSQTYPNIEIIVCDNSTDDRTEELMRAYRDDVRVRYIRNKEARTKEENFMPFEHLAQGEFLQWCMDDDILLPDKITQMVDAFLLEPTATLVTSIRGIIDRDGEFLGQWKNAPSIYGAYGCFGGAAIGHAMLMNHSSFLGEPSAVLFRRSDLTHHYWRAESRGYQILSDCAMWLELLEKGGAVVFAQPLSLFRTHSGQEQRQPESLVRAAVEWRRLIEEYWHKRIFLTKEEDYRAALTALRETCKSVVDPLLPQVSPALRREYGSGKPAIRILLMNRITECATVRVDAPLTRLAACGHVSVGGCTRDGDSMYRFEEIAALHDTLIFFQRANIARSVQTEQILARAGAQGNVLLQEMDDHPMVSSQAVQDDYFLFRAVSAVQTSTKYLADFLRELNPYVYLFENQLEVLPERRSYDARADRVTIFFGALNRRKDWEPLMPAINNAIRRHGDRLYFRVVSDHEFYQALETAAKEFTGGMRDGDIVAPYERYTAALHASDIALLPLRDTEFNRAKSDLKFIESAGHGAAVLASPTVYVGTVRDGETGMIFRSPKEFAEKLDLLIRRADLRHTLAENAYRYVAEHRLLDQHIDDYIHAYREIFERREELESARLRRVAKIFPDL